MTKKLKQGKKYYQAAQYEKALALFDKIESEFSLEDLSATFLADKANTSARNTKSGEKSGDSKSANASGIAHTSNTTKAANAYQSNHQSPEFMEFMYYKGLCLTKLGRYNEALHYLEQVVNSDLGFLYIYQSRMILGYIYSVTDRFKLAEYEFNKLLTEGVESVQIYSLLGYVAYSQNKIPQSISFLKKALKIDANYPNALNCLGFIYAEKNIDTVEAIILCKKAVNLKPENYAYLDSLGWAYYKNNQTQQARTYLGKALDLAPDNPEIINHIQILMNKTS